MKKIYTIILILSVSIVAQAQNYIPFPTSNTIWTQRHGNGDTIPSYFCYGLTNEDTMVNNVLYHTLFRSADTVFDASERLGGLREDSLKRVFYYSFSNGQERLLYDFSVQPGDTVDSNPGAAGIVHSIDSIDISGIYHKRINFATPDGNFWTYGAWIEGMGNASLGGLINTAFVQPTCDCADNIICFKQNGQWGYHNPLYSTTDCVNDALEVGKIEVSKVMVTIYPNPVTGTGTLRVDGSVSNGTINIYSITGTLLHAYPVSNKSSISISRNDYPSGIYFYRLIAGAGNVAGGKFVVE